MICIIPAREGSKRLPGKNKKQLFGFPMLEHTVRICERSELFDFVVISTDDPEIKEMDICETWMRPEYLAGDKSETDVLKYHMDIMKLDYICRVYSFACLLTEQRLTNGLMEFYRSDYECVMERQKYQHNPIRGMFEKGDYMLPTYVSEPSETLPAVYHDAGTFMFTTRNALSYPLELRKIKWITIGEMDAQDVDTEEDFELLKLKYFNRGLIW
jgi:pseudaminic acid cytidylyltransferase